ncbi:transposase family protein [Streptomyces sp. 900105755]
MTGVITASEPSWTAPFSGLSQRCFGKLVTSLRSEGVGTVGRGRPCLSLEDRVLLVAAYWRTNLTMRQLALLFGMSRNCRYATNHQVVIDADSRLVVVVRRPLPGNRNDCKAWQLSGAKDAVGKTTVIADGGYRGTGLVIPHRRERGQTELPARKEEHNASHRKVGARVEHAFARMEGWKILRDCRRAGIPCEDQETKPPDGGAACRPMVFRDFRRCASRRWSWRRALVPAGGLCRKPG